ncbi:hypothetical protein J1N35_031106 [Gossypium stocksii]|uniref:Uncharacterized protein n=1 Tax=Gossypium stocksii TaxID=47602 RepID=A0A9D3V215_9ROSI|nr:hypothetical protein J1N35_031106 [Gossypium stocksii]
MAENNKAMQQLNLMKQKIASKVDSCYTAPAANGSNNLVTKKGRGAGGMQNQLVNRALDGISFGGRGGRRGRGRSWDWAGRGRGRGYL